METEHDDAYRDGGGLSLGGNIDYIEFLKKVLPDDGWSVLVAIHPVSEKIHGLGVSRETIDEVPAWVGRHSEWNLYWSTNSLNARLDKKPKKEDIVYMEWVHLDCDDPSPEALERLRNYEVPPTLIVFSGGGYQGFWRLRHPIHVNGNIGALEAANVRVLQDLDPKHMGTQNLDRIMRLPGTVNWPTKTKLASGRKPTEARLIEVHSDRTYRLEDFRAPAQTPVEVVAKKAKSEAVDRSAVLFRHVLRAVRDGDTDEDILAENGTDPHVLSQPENRRRGTIQRCIDKARALVDAEAVAVEEMNERHAAVLVGNHLYFLWRDRWNEGMPVLMGKTDMANYYANRPGKPFEAWLRSPDRAEVKIVFEPGIAATEDKFNVWRGFAVEPSDTADCSLFLQMVLDVICSGDVMLFKYVMAWCADAVQNPAKRPGVVLVLKGEQGTGKGTFAHAIGALFGDHYAYASRSRHVTGNFNAHLANKLLMFADEALFAGDKANDGALKSLITEDELPVEMKGKDVIKLRNHLRIIMASNQDWVVPAALDDRRFAIIDVSPSRKQQPAYFGPIKNQLDNGGKEALLHYLLAFDLTGIELRDLPKTDARWTQQQLSMSPIEKWWYGRLQSGAPVSNRDDWPEELLKSEMFDDYMRESGLSGARHRGNMTEFGMTLHRLIPGLGHSRMLVKQVLDKHSQKMSAGTRANTYKLPPLAECREDFAKRIGHEVTWPQDGGADRPWKEHEM